MRARGEAFESALVIWLTVLVVWGATSVLDLSMWSLALGYALLPSYHLTRMLVSDVAVKGEK